MQAPTRDAPAAHRLEAEERPQQPVRPAPTSPAMPRISPRCSVNVAPPRPKPVDLEKRLAGGARRPRDRAPRRRGRPSSCTISSPAASRGGAAADVPAVAQHDEAVGDLVTSSMKCEM